ncbi:rhodanese-like domain-containing protein [Agromyces sp. SYSU T00194]|uniref:rhodanese-like domain-containing protein n=1 Tax=Agromyces chitinivorans TaxID=3158560 RepID=UPI0033950C44
MSDHSPALRPFTRFAAVVAAAVATLFALTACAPSEPIDVSADTVVIDVRTPEEYAAGHLDGAVNIDVQSSGFDAAIAELDPEGSYVVYCRSGNRSAAAIDRMEAAGFTDLVNAGGLQDAADATGIPIVAGT